MGINRVTKRGKTRWEVRRRWPDRTTFRRFYPNRALAEKMLLRIKVAVAEGKWRELKHELYKPADVEVPKTAMDCSGEFIEKYCKVRLRSWKRYELSFKTINKVVGHIRLTDFRRSHLHEYVQKRARQVSAGTINRDIACMKKMFSFAFEMGWVQHHPLVRFPLLRTQEMSRPVLSLEEFRRLIESVDEAALSAMIAVMGETGIRKGEALNLQWKNVDLKSRVLTVDRTKSGKVRQVPLSPFAIEKLMQLPRSLKHPQVFVNTATEQPWTNPEKAFKQACRNADLKWLGFHDLRRFRATEWVRSGVDIRTVKELLGHADIQTTLTYVRFVPSALDHVRRVQRLEDQRLRETSGRQMGDTASANFGLSP